MAGEASRHETRRGVSDLPATRAIRSHRHPPPGARDRSVRQLPPVRLRLRHAAQLGAARSPLSPGRHVAGPAPAARRLVDIRQHARPCVEGAGLRRPVLGEWRRRLADPEDVVLYERRRRSAGGHHPDTRSGRCPHGSPPRRPRWNDRAEIGAQRTAVGNPLMWVFIAIGVGVLALAHTAPAPFLFDAIAGDRSVWHMPRRTPPAVYLTFDDGPNPTTTPDLLDVLARAGA